MSKFVKLLEYYKASTYDKVKMIKSPSFVHTLGKETHKKLLLSENLEDELLQKELIDVIIQGVDYNKVIRNAIPVLKSKSGDDTAILSHENMDDFADIVPEGSPIPISHGEFKSTGISYKKIATRVRVTSEILEDSRWDELELELKLAGMRLENTLNRFALGVMLDGCSTSDISGINTAKLIEGIETVQNEKFIADKLLLHPKGLRDLYGPTGYHLVNLSKGETEIFGLQQYMLQMNTHGAEAKWTSASGTKQYYGLLYDYTSFARLVIREDINVNKFKDFESDILNLTAKMRIDVGITQPKAGVKFLSA